MTAPQHDIHVNHEERKEGNDANRAENHEHMFPVRPMQPFTVAALVSLASLVGFGAGMGIWAGGQAQVSADQERRISAHDLRLDRLEATSQSSQISLAKIETQLTALLNATMSRRRDDDSSPLPRPAPSR